MDEAELLAPLAFVIISLIAGAILKLVLTKINLPYTVGLFVLGIGVGVLNMNGYLEATPVISESLNMVKNLDPDMILNIFLPVLIFSAAYELDIHVFKKTLFNSTLLAVPGLIVAMFLTAAVMMGISFIAPAYSGWNWTFALMFGALISATDPVAVVALLGELGVSKRFSTLIDGESMLNDGTGIVLFMLMFAPFTSSVESADSSPVMSFLIVVLGGLLIGFLMAKAFLYYATRKSVKSDSLLQTSVMILLSYITFILAQDIFKLSGVIALVMFGLVVAYDGASKISERARHFMKEFWELLAYIANTLIFIIIGVIIAEKVDFEWMDLAVLLIVYVGVNIVRMAMIAIFYPIMKRSGYGITKRESLILTWGALRGALGLTLALMVSYTDSIPEDIRRQVLMLTAGIVTLTLVVNATTIKWLLAKLGLLEESAPRQMIAAEVRSKLHSKSLNYLESLRQDHSICGAEIVNWEELKEWLPKRASVPTCEIQGRDVLMGLRTQVISGERELFGELFSRGVIEIEAQRRLVAALDTMIDKDGELPLDERIEILGLSEEWFVNSAAKAKRDWCSFMRRKLSPIVCYEVAYGVLLSQRRAVEIVNSYLSTQILNPAQKSKIEQINCEVARVVESAQIFITRFAEEYPKEYAEALTARAQRMLRHFEMETIDEFVSTGVIEKEDAAQLKCEVAERSHNE